MIIESNHVQKKEKQGDLLSLIRFGIVMDVLQHIGEGCLGVSLWYRRYILHHNNIAMNNSLKGKSKDLNVLETSAAGLAMRFSMKLLPCTWCCKTSVSFLTLPLSDL